MGDDWEGRGELDRCWIGGMERGGAAAVGQWSRCMAWMDSVGFFFVGCMYRCAGEFGMGCRRPVTSSSV